MKNNKGILVVLSGFSGSGKGTIMKELVRKYDYALSISATTRNPREGEENGREYYFLSREKFEEMIGKDGFIEYAEYVGNYYGTPKEYVNNQLESGHNVLLEIEMQGGMLVKEQFPDAVLLFVTPPSVQILYDRLVGRGTEDMETVKKRLTRASEEAKYMKDYDYIIINDILDETVDNVHNVIETEHFRTHRQADLMNRMTEELDTLQKGF